jgi:hypothetical protein
LNDSGLYDDLLHKRGLMKREGQNVESLIRL